MSKTIRTVLVGCGKISGAWLGPITGHPAEKFPQGGIREIELVGLVDLVEAAAKKRQTDFGLAQTPIGTDLAKMLKATRPDLVIDCTIPAAHTANALTAFRHGCHVLSEKPLADSMANARRAVKAAEKAGKVYAIMQNRRYEEGICRAQKFVADGTLGALTTVHSDFFIGVHFGGFREQMEHVLLLDMAIHTFDAARLMMQADPVSVYCKEWNPKGSWYKHGASVAAIFEMTGGIVYTYRGSWCSEGLRTNWGCDWRLIGDRGSMLWDGAQKFSAEVLPNPPGSASGWTPVTVPPFGGNKPMGGHAGVIRDFVTCLQTGRTPETVCTDNIKSLAMVFGAIRSADTGKRVAIKV